MIGDGPKAVVLDDEEAAILKVYRELRRFGFGEMRVIVLQNKLEAVNPTYHYKRKDIVPDPIDKGPGKG